MPNDMPDDFWPDRIVVDGRYEHGGREYRLAFTLSREELRAARINIFQERMNALRQALWLSSRKPKLYEAVVK